MAYGLFNFGHPERLEFGDDLRAFVQNGLLRLRRLDTATQSRYDPFGKYYETTIVLENWHPTALRGLFGFYPFEVTWGGADRASASVSPTYVGYGDYASTGAPIIEPVVYPVGLGTGLSPLGPDHLYPDVRGYGYRRGDGRLKSYEFGGSVTYRLSADDGTTWLVWDTGAWQEATGALASRWNTALEVDSGFNVFPFHRSDPQIRVTIKLTPSSDGERTPGLDGMIFFCDYLYNHNEDLFRSIKHYMEANLKVSTKWTDPDANGATTFQMDLSGDQKTYDWAKILAENAEVYNATDDPTYANNLFSALTADEHGLVLSSAQTGELVAEIFAVPWVFITAEELYNITHNPSVVCFVPTVAEERELRQGHYLMELSPGRRVARATYHQTYHKATCRITSFSNKHHEAIAMNDAVERALTQYRDLPSDALDTLFAIVGASPTDDLNRVGTALFAKNFSMEVVARTFLRPDFAIDIPYVEEFNVMLRPVRSPRRLAWSET